MGETATVFVAEFELYRQFPVFDEETLGKAHKLSAASSSRVKRCTGWLV